MMSAINNFTELFPSHNNNSLAVVEIEKYNELLHLLLEKYSSSSSSSNGGGGGDSTENEVDDSVLLKNIKNVMHFYSSIPSTNNSTAQLKKIVLKIICLLFWNNSIKGYTDLLLLSSRAKEDEFVFIVLFLSQVEQDNSTTGDKRELVEKVKGSGYGYGNTLLFLLQLLLSQNNATKNSSSSSSSTSIEFLLKKGVLSELLQEIQQYSKREDFVDEMVYYELSTCVFQLLKSNSNSSDYVYLLKRLEDPYSLKNTSTNATTTTTTTSSNEYKSLLYSTDDVSNGGVGGISSDSSMLQQQTQSSQSALKDLFRILSLILEYFYSNQNGVYQLLQDKFMELLLSNKNQQLGFLRLSYSSDRMTMECRECYYLLLASVGKLYPKELSEFMGNLERNSSVSFEYVEKCLEFYVQQLQQTQEMISPQDCGMLCALLQICSSILGNLSATTDDSTATTTIRMQLFQLLFRRVFQLYVMRVDVKLKCALLECLEAFIHTTGTNSSSSIVNVLYQYIDASQILDQQDGLQQEFLQELKDSTSNSSSKLQHTIAFVSMLRTMFRSKVVFPSATSSTQQQQQSGGGGGKYVEFLISVYMKVLQSAQYQQQQQQQQQLKRFNVLLQLCVEAMFYLLEMFNHHNNHQQDEQQGFTVDHTETAANTPSTVTVSTILNSFIGKLLSGTQLYELMTSHFVSQSNQDVDVKMNYLELFYSLFVNEDVIMQTISRRKYTGSHVVKPMSLFCRRPEFVLCVFTQLNSCGDNLTALKLMVLLTEEICRKNADQLVQILKLNIEVIDEGLCRVLKESSNVEEEAKNLVLELLVLGLPRSNGREYSVTMLLLGYDEMNVEESDLSKSKLMPVLADLLSSTAAAQESNYRIARLIAEIFYRLSSNLKTCEPIVKHLRYTRDFYYSLHDSVLESLVLETTSEAQSEQLLLTANVFRLITLELHLIWINRDWRSVKDGVRLITKYQQIIPILFAKLSKVLSGHLSDYLKSKKCTVINDTLLRDLVQKNYKFLNPNGVELYNIHEITMHFFKRYIKTLEGSGMLKNPQAMAGARQELHCLLEEYEKKNYLNLLLYSKLDCLDCVCSFVESSLEYVEYDAMKDDSAVQSCSAEHLHEWLSKDVIPSILHVWTVSAMSEFSIRYSSVAGTLFSIHSLLLSIYEHDETLGASHELLLACKTFLSLLDKSSGRDYDEETKSYLYSCLIVYLKIFEKSSFAVSSQLAELALQLVDSSLVLEWKFMLLSKIVQRFAKGRKEDKTLKNQALEMLFQKLVKTNSVNNFLLTMITEDDDSMLLFFEAMALYEPFSCYLIENSSLYALMADPTLATQDRMSKYLPLLAHLQTVKSNEIRALESSSKLSVLMDAQKIYFVKALSVSPVPGVTFQQIKAWQNVTLLMNFALQKSPSLIGPDYLNVLETLLSFLMESDAFLESVTVSMSMCIDSSFDEESEEIKSSECNKTALLAPPCFYYGNTLHDFCTTGGTIPLSLLHSQCWHAAQSVKKNILLFLTNYLFAKKKLNCPVFIFNEANTGSMELDLNVCLSVAKKLVGLVQKLQDEITNTTLLDSEIDQVIGQRIISREKRDHALKKMLKSNLGKSELLLRDVLQSIECYFVLLSVRLKPSSANGVKVSDHLFLNQQVYEELISKAKSVIEDLYKSGEQILNVEPLRRVVARVEAGIKA